jgi:hypothetical protein
MNQNLGIQAEIPVAPEPVLRERLERAIGILESAQGTANFINGKLFMPRNEVCNDQKEPPSNGEMEFLINKVCGLAGRLESSLNYINEKL